MDRAVEIVAKKRLERFPQEWKEELVQLTPSEQEVIKTLVAYLDARPSDEVVPGGRHDGPEREGGGSE